MMKFGKFIRIASLTLAIFSFALSSAQENQGHHLAENTFANYHKWGLVVGGSILYVTNEKNAISYRYLNLKAFNLGVTYNFFQYKNFNANIGFIYRKHSIKNFQNLKKEDSGLPIDNAGFLTVSPYHEYKIPLQGEYFFPLYKKLTGFVGLGPELSFQRKVLGTGSLTLQPNGKDIGYTETEDYNYNINVGANISLGLNIKLGALLLRPFATYHYQPGDLYTAIVTTQNLKVSQNTVSKHTITGNYLMFGVSILPGKNLFSSKKK